MAITNEGAKGAHSLLNILLAQDEARAIGDQAGDVITLAMSTLDPALFHLSRGENGELRLDVQAFVEAAVAPMLWLTTELSACADLTFDEIVAHARDYIESQRPNS
ncbi:MAG: hypothetical protein WKF79_02385 [Nocardioides sp.]